MSKRAKISLLCWLVVVITGIVQLSAGLASGTIGYNNGTFLLDSTHDSSHGTQDQTQVQSVHVVNPDIHFTATPTADQNGWTNSAAILFAWNSTESDKVRYKMDDSDWTGWGSTSNSITYSTLSEGLHTFYLGVKYRDKEDSYTLNWPFGVDRTKPEVSINEGPTQGSVITVNSCKFTWAGTDVLSGIKEYKYKFNTTGDTWNTIGYNELTRTFTGLTNGDYTFTVVAIDNAGNQSLPAIRSFKVSLSSINPTPSPTPNPDSDNYAAAPAVATKLLKEAGIKPNDKTKNVNYISEVAKHMGPSTDFDGVHKEQVKDYETKIKAFLKGLGADLD